MNKLKSILKDSNTNWKYLLIVVVLGLLFSGGILVYQYWWAPRYDLFLIEFPKIKKPLEGEIPWSREEISSDEMISIFKKIFPDGNTNSDLNKIADINERAVKYFKPFSLPVGDWESIVNGRYRFVELDGLPGEELIVIHYFLEKLGPPSGSDMYIYIFQLSNSKWRLIGNIFFGWRSSLQLLSSWTNGFRDILYRHALSAGSYEVDLYKWDGSRYVKEDKGVCDLKDSSSEACSYQGNPLYWGLHE